ncbi:UPF0701 protein YloC [hydrothermal vent metagenome]|uniref:UPF0701 protein YloC n=1 Tax=hydrothermal vent metagenome TaxID=652676 RepID=A0A3B0R5R2_9ZZZZ
MAVKSMTGYGRAEFDAGGGSYGLELRSLNHRYLELSVRVPERFYPFEVKVREALKKKFARGAFALFINTLPGTDRALELNTGMVNAYQAAAERLKNEFGVSGELNAGFFLRQKDIFSATEGAEHADEDWSALDAALGEAAGLLSSMRADEGARLVQDIMARLGVIERYLGQVASLAPELSRRYREKLIRDMGELLGKNFDEARIIAEAAILAEKSDITEEVVRFRSHIEQFGIYLNADEPVGRRLDFLCQEMLREANTIGSKSHEVDITRAVVEVKGELDKVREQVQNIE